MFHDLADHLERIHSTRLALRRVAISDAWPLYTASRNPEFNAHLMWDRPANVGAVLDRMDVISSASRRGELTAMSAVVKDTGQWLSLYRFIPYQPGILEMGVWTHSLFWKERFTLELTRLCIDAAFDHMKIDSLLAAAAPANFPSCAVLDRAGLKPLGMVSRRKENGETVQLREYIIHRQEWAAHRLNAPEYFNFSEPLPTTVELRHEHISAD